jgi:hypothetical protein
MAIMPNVSAFESRCWMFKKMCMVLTTLILSVVGAGAQEGFPIIVFPFPQMTLNPQGGSGGYLSSGAQYKVVLENPFPPGAEVWAQFEPPGGAFPPPHPDPFMYFQKMPTFQTGNSREIGFQVSPYQVGPHARIKVAFFQNNVWKFTDTLEVGMSGIRPATYACVATISGFTFKTPYIYAGATLPYSGGQLYTSCATQNATQIPRGTNIIFGGSGFAYYNFNVSPAAPYLSGVSLTTDTGMTLPFLGFVQLPSMEQQLLFQVPANAPLGSHVLAFTVAGNTAYFIVTFI